MTPKVQYVPAIKVPPLIMSTCFKRGEILRNVIVREKAGQQSENKTRTGMGMAECLPGVWKTLDCLRNKANKKRSIRNWKNNFKFLVGDIQKRRGWEVRKTGPESTYGNGNIVPKSVVTMQS